MFEVGWASYSIMEGKFQWLIFHSVTMNPNTYYVIDLGLLQIYYARTLHKINEIHRPTIRTHPWSEPPPCQMRQRKKIGCQWISDDKNRQVQTFQRVDLMNSKMLRTRVSRLRPFSLRTNTSKILAPTWRPRSDSLKEKGLQEIVQSLNVFTNLTEIQTSKNG